LILPEADRGKNPMRDEDETAFKEFHERAKWLGAVFRRGSHNLIEEIEKLGFTYVVDDHEDAEEIAEEGAARPATDFELELVSYLDGEDQTSEHLLELWREETRREHCQLPLWRRYFRAGNVQLKKLILFGLDQHPTNHDLLDDLSVLHSFLPMPKELMRRFTLACDLEDDKRSFRELAQDFDAGASSFGYDALHAMRARYADNNAKKTIIDGLLIEREKHEEGMAF
jgi:hypothetical protein